AGGYINYYYYGIYLVSMLIKLTGITSEVAFNLAVPTLFALTIVNAFAVAYNVQASRARRQSQETVIPPRHSPTPLLSGLCAAAFIAVVGNLDGFVQIAEGFGKVANTEFHSGIIGVDGLVHMLLGAPAVLLEGRALPAFDYWRSSRVIPFSINEFPLWSFLFADLHPHMIGIPFTLLAIALAAHSLMTPGKPSGAGRDDELDGTAELRTPLAGAPLHLRGVGVYVNPPRSDALLTSRTVLTGFVFALVLGAIAAINTWDAPTYLGLTLGALVLPRYWSPDAHRSWLRTLIEVAVLAALSIGLYAPFFNSYKALYVGLGVSDQHTEFQPFVIVWGFFL
ncbi:MAG: DUF2298 domain-containing protein, partial [Chloroflexi bacterium]|nr:DUF2298 domain-containing protein [Chloroflexota bacterium]